MKKLNLNGKKRYIVGAVVLLLMFKGCSNESNDTVNKEVTKEVATEVSVDEVKDNVNNVDKETNVVIVEEDNVKDFTQENESLEFFKQEMQKNIIEPITGLDVIYTDAGVVLIISANDRAIQEAYQCDSYLISNSTENILKSGYDAVKLLTDRTVTVFFASSLILDDDTIIYASYTSDGYKQY